MWTRRHALGIGGLTALGLSLPGILRAEERARTARPAPRTGGGKAKSCILFFMEGGPSHIDLWDMKPNAPSEVRGIYQPISTSVPGLQISEQLPSWAPIMRHLAVVRSVNHKIVDHNASSYYALTGHSPMRDSKLIRRPSRDNAPPIGAVLAKLRPSGRPLPDFVHIPKRMINCGSFIPAQLAGFLGDAYDPFITGDPSKQNYQVPGLAPLQSLSQERLDERRDLLRRFRDRTDTDRDPTVQRLDRYYEKAYSLVTSPLAREAFRLDKEPESMRRKYGIGEQALSGDTKLSHLCASMLLARRLIEAGVRLVTVWAGRQAFDTHRKHFPAMNRLCPYLDRAFAALITDLADRGLLDETLVVAVGEFGRTPRLGQITSLAGAGAEGRDHWPHCYTAMLAGGGIQPGAVYGASDRLAAYPEQNPVAPQDIAATIYTALGIDPQTRIQDAFNRPHTLADGQPIEALL